jgi:inner membrane protein
MEHWLNGATLWFILGVFLLVIELTVSGVLAVFFAAGAWVAAILLWLGVIESFWLQLAVFLVVSLASMLFLRRRLKAVLLGKAGPNADTEAALDDIAGKLATVVEPINATLNTGKVEFRGTHWIARCTSSVEKGRVVRIASRDNLTLTVEPTEETSR